MNTQIKAKTDSPIPIYPSLFLFKNRETTPRIRPTKARGHPAHPQQNEKTKLQEAASAAKQIEITPTINAALSLLSSSILANKSAISHLIKAPLKKTDGNIIRLNIKSNFLKKHNNQRSR